MGAESSILEDTAWEEPYPNGHWSIRHGKHDGSEITQFTPLQKDRVHYQSLEKLIKNLRSVRHPSVLTYVCSDTTSNSPQLVTEKAVPLETVLSSLSSTEVCAGLHSLLDALAFLHENVGACHNNVHLGAVYVASDSSWRMGGLEHMCKFSEATSAFLDSCKALRNQEALSPEEKQGKLNTAVELGHARDIYAFAVMTESLLEKMLDLGDLTKTFELRIQDECLHSDPSHRPTARSLLNDRLFNTEFLSVALFLKNVALKSEEERKIFFRNLLPRLIRLPEELVARRLVPTLLSRFVFLDQSAVEYVLPSLLTPNQGEKTQEEREEKITPLLTESVFQQFVVPKLVKIFSVHDFHVHILLLQYFPKFVHLIDKEDLEFDVFPQILLGLRDSSDQIAALSLHALAEMVPILGRDTVIGGKSKTYFKEGLPKNCSNGMMPTINNKHSNVSGVLGKMRLVDLAKQSETGRVQHHKTEDVDKKWKEREIRREEMKKKREERKKAREKTRGTIKKVEDLSGLELGTTEEAKDTESLHHSIETAAESPRITDDDHIIEDLRNDWSKENSISDLVRSNEISAVNETEEADWSGWSEEGGDSEISDEIERELQNMDLSNESQKHSETTHVPSKDISKADDSVKHSMAFLPKPGAMKLSTDKHKIAKNQTEISLSDTLIELEKSEKRKNIPFQSENIGTKNPSKAPMTGAKATPIKKSDHKGHNLGAEFEIKSLDIKVISKQDDPFDFFADMAPKIESKRVDIDAVSEGLGSVTDKPSGLTSESQGSTGSKFSLKVADTTAEDTEVGGGWGDDDW